jgi:transcriptional regulator with GAF, ATPase, and Fis domain
VPQDTWALMNSTDPADTDRLAIPLNAFLDLVDVSLHEDTTESALEKVIRVGRETVGGCDEASVTLITEAGPRTAVFTGQLALDLDESQYQRGYGPCLDAAVGGGILKIDETRTETRWPDYARAAAERGARSSMSVPISAQAGVSGALNFYATQPDAFDDASCELGTALAAYAATAVRNLRHHESARREAEAIQRAMQSRAVIEQAKGILMRDRGCTADEAFDLLVATSQRSNHKLRDVAQQLVDGVRSQHTD